MSLRARPGFILGLLVWLCWHAAAVRAHPLSQGTMDVVVESQRLTVALRVTVEEALITGMLAGPADLDEAQRYHWHAQYLLEHLHLAADDHPLDGRVVAVLAPGAPASDPGRRTETEHAFYELEFGLGPGLNRPRKIEFRQDVLVGKQWLPGVNWDASYTLRITDGAQVSEGLLLTTQSALVHPLDAPQAADRQSRAGQGAMVRGYISHGIHHILGGYDHLLFITALVLAARKLWDLVKVVTAFTLAHTLTLALAALQLVHVPAALVEPMIAASIVVVAVQNVFWPSQVQGWTRLALAFGFGLFHGLGFAGGLLDTMQELSGLTILLAIAAFSLGVEIGHQLIVIPLFAALSFARWTRAARTQAGERSLAVRYGSALVGIAGLYYLVAALGTAFSIGSV